MLVPPRRNRGPMTAMQLVQSPPAIRNTCIALVALLLVGIVAMLLAPWQQNARGSGRIVAYSPTERPQTIESPIYGRVVQWGEGITEGRAVKKGEFILEIRDIDETKAQRLVDQVQATRDKLNLAKLKAETYGRQAVDLAEAREMIIRASQELVEEARRKVEAEKQAVAAAEAAERQTSANNTRQQQLFRKGFSSGANAEMEQRKYDEAIAKTRAAKEYVAAASNYLAAKEHELQQKSREAQTKVDYARAMQQESLGDVALTTKDLLELQGKQAQFESRKIVAPRDGIIFRLFVNENAEMLKEGDPLFTIVPETEDRAVELFVDGNDVPLITAGNEVRLQFEGYPAVQFAAGWPEVAAGTFAGEVVTVDATDDGKGKFRLVVRPQDGEEWPDARFLRQGVRANGWVLLKRVTLGYELWRQLNGFPPIYGDGKPTDTDYVKKPKLPK